MSIFNSMCHHLSLRLRRRLIAFTYHLLISVLCFLGFFIGLTKLSAAILLADILTFRIIPVLRWFEEILIEEASCYSCGAAIDLVGVYKCGCGFVSWKERHAFSPCPMCGKYFNWIVCPECETTIPI